MTSTEGIGYDAAVNHAYRTSVLCLLSAMASGGCSDADPAEDGAPGVPAYQGPSNSGSSGTNSMGGGTAPAPAQTGNGNSESTQVNQLAPGSAGAGSGSSGNSMPATPAMPEDPAQPVAPEVGASTGCGVAQGRPATPTVTANTIFTFPDGYDGSTPFPLLFAFHGANRNNQQMREQDSRTPGSELEANYVVAYMKSAGTAWNLGADYPRFEAELAEILAQRCIDQSRVFAMGHSSGAQFIVQMLGDDSARETRLAAVAPVSSSLFQNPPWNPIPTLLIHGLNDTARPNDPDGADDISQYAASNQCSGGMQPVNVPSCASLAQGAAVDAGCMQYSGCAATTLFCNHDDPNYLDNGNPTNHGWPCFANSQIFQFLEAVR